MTSKTPISEIMTREIETVLPSDTFQKVRDIFTKRGFHHLPVVNDDRKVVGMISKKDMLRLALTLCSVEGEEELDGQTVETLMSKHPFMLEPDDTVGLAADVFRANQFHAIPVINEEGELLGMITTHDIIKHVFDPIG